MIKWGMVQRLCSKGIKAGDKIRELYKSFGKRAYVEEPRWKSRVEAASLACLTCNVETELLWKDQVWLGGKYKPPR